MTAGTAQTRNPAKPALSSGAAGALTFALVAGIGTLDRVAGWNKSFTLFYLLPIAVAFWFAGRRIGFGICVAATIASSLAKISAPLDLISSSWNAGVRLGIFLIFGSLLNYIRAGTADARVIRSLTKLLGVTAVAAGSLALIGLLVETTLPKPAAARLADVIDVSAGPTTSPGSVSQLQSLLKGIASSIDLCMDASRPVLIGSRDPKGPSVVPISRHGDVHDRPPLLIADWDGGPGTRLSSIYFRDRETVKTPQDDFVWHQTRLKTFLQNQAATNSQAAEHVVELAAQAQRFLNAIDECPVFPDDLSAIPFNNDGDWPRYCLTRLDESVARGDLALSRQWARELAAATFTLADLHAWLDFLVRNHLAALEFQARCQTLFSAATPMLKNYDFHSTISQFPAGVLSLNGVGNYYEIERQAERLFSMPPDRLEEIRFNLHRTDGSIWVMPSVREPFLKMQQVLSAENRKTFELAARTPFEHSYLVNMLYRAGRSDMADEMCASLKRFDQNEPHATVTALMGAMMYRGHSYAGLEWDDRFQPQLVEAAAAISGPDPEAFLAASRWTYNFYKSQSVYGTTYTLRDALTEHRLDCVRATDMTGAIFRDAGRSRFGHVRWCAETVGHAVAAYLGAEDNKLKTLLADGLAQQDKLEIWPDAYFHGHAWPAGFEGAPTPYAMELYVRGIDSYVWAEGYIVRGPNAGTLVKSGIPYLPLREKSSDEKIFAGPYPN